MTLPSIVQRLRAITTLNRQLSELTIDSTLLEPFKDVITAPLVDHTGGVETSVTTTSYEIAASTPVVSNNNIIKVPVTITCTDLPSHVNGAGTAGYWLGLGILQKAYYNYSTQAAAAWASMPDSSSTWMPASGVRDNVYIVGDKIYDTFYFGYNPDNASRKGFVAYRYEQSGNVVYIIYEITFNVTVV